MSEQDIFYSFGFIVAGVFLTGAFSMSLQGITYGANYKCGGETTCLWLKEAASRVKLMLQLALGEADIAKGFKGSFQGVVLVAILLVLVGRWRTDVEHQKRSITIKACVVFGKAACN